MENKSMDMKSEVWRLFQKTQTIYLATCDAGQPRVRPVSLIYYNDRFWVATGTYNAKVIQIRENKKVEFCYLLERFGHNGYIRGAGEARIVKDMKTRKLLADNMEFFGEYWTGVDDPNYCLIEIIMRDIEYLKPGALEAEKFSV